MRSRDRKLSFILTTGLLLFYCSCSVITPFRHPPRRLLRQLQTAPDSSYGYSPSNPVCLGYYPPQQSISFSYLYLFQLRNQNNRPFIVERQGSIADPKMEKLFDFGITPAGGILDIYHLIQPDHQDTLVLYIDIYHAGQLYIPQGLIFAKPR